MKVNFVKKMCALSLSALMLTGAGLCEAAPIISASLPVYAAETAAPASHFDYKEDDNGMITITKYKGTGGNVVIPAVIDGKNVVEIGDNAFSKCKGVRSVTIPYGVWTIGKSAFLECTGMTSITIPDSVTTIDDNAFENCSGLRSVTIPESVTYLGERAFLSCTGLKRVDIPASLPELHSYTFKYCTGLKEVNFEEGFSTIGMGAFYGCTGLETIVLPDGLTRIESDTFAYCTGLKNVTIPDSVTYIGGKDILAKWTGAFYGCSGLQKVTIPESVTDIDSDAFPFNMNLTIYGVKGSMADEYAYIEMLNFVAITPPLKNTSDIAAEKVTLGKSTTISLSASGGKTPYKFSVLYKKSTGTKWTTLVSNTTKTTVKFTPKAAATYNVKIIAKDSEGKAVSKIFSVTAAKPLTNTSKLGADTIKLGNKVKVRCYAKGGTGEYTYAVYYKKSSKTNYTKLRDFKGTNIVMFKPAAAVSYDIQVKAKDSSGKVVSKVLKLKVTK